jgi:hypothetical protein
MVVGVVELGLQMWIRKICPRLSMVRKWCVRGKVSRQLERVHIVWWEEMHVIRVAAIRIVDK